jgi:sulfopyruvate decarboxylase TPP-binding subunit
MPMDPKDHAAAIVAGIKKAGIDFVVTLPDKKMGRR